MTIVSDDPAEIEEERRLCYVGITRAEKILNLSSAKMRMVRGETQMNKVSRFIKEIPEEYMHIEIIVQDIIKVRLHMEEKMTQRKHVRIISEPMPKPLLTDTVQAM